jgi:hypothetical protein
LILCNFFQGKSNLSGLGALQKFSVLYLQQLIGVRLYLTGDQWHLTMNRQ